MINCIAIDDEPLALELLEDNIRQVPYLNLVGKSSNAIDALKLLKETNVDLVFLDIQMPGLTGLQLIKSLAVKPMFILVTAYEKFALEGFNLDVVDYLVKPVSLDRFIKACNKAQELHELRTSNKPVETKSEEDYFFINVDYSLVKILFKNIIWIEGLKDYIKIYLKDSSKPVVTRLSMKALEDELPTSLFIRIHKSYIISKNFITSVKKSSVFLDNKTELPVGESYKEGIEELVSKRKF
jgi:two-component system, LytTR family, response regulator